MSEEFKQRSKVEEELILKERSLEHAQKIASLGNWEWFVAEDRFVLSQEMAKLLGLPLEELVINHE